MDTKVISIKDANGKPSRLFTIFFKPKDTLRILDAPSGLYITEPKTHTQFCVWQKPFIDEKTLFFEYGDECYNFVSKTGFKTDEEHLNWLISLGRIPMGENSKILGKEKFVIMGYVQFADERALLPEYIEDKPLHEHFLKKLLEGITTGYYKIAETTVSKK